MQNYVQFPRDEDGGFSKSKTFSSPEREVDIIEKLTRITMDRVRRGGGTPIEFIQMVMDATEPTNPVEVAMITYMATRTYSDFFITLKGLEELVSRFLNRPNPTAGSTPSNLLEDLLK